MTSESSMHEPGTQSQCSGGKGGTPVHLWLIHVDVRQNPSQYCKAIILQLKLIN